MSNTMAPAGADAAELTRILSVLRSMPVNQTTKTEISQVLCKLAYAYHRSDPASAEKHSLEALSFADSAGYKKGIAEALTLLGTLSWVRGNFTRAAECYTKSLKVCEESGNRKGIASCYSNLANIRRNQGDYERALELHFKALSIKEEIKDRAGIAKSYNNIGIIYDEWNEFESALEFYNKALHIFEELGDLQGIAITYNNTGVIYETQKNYTHALEEYKKSLAMKESIGDKKGIGNSYTNIGTLFETQGEHDQALEYCVRALDIFEEIGDKRGIADSNNQIGNIYTKLEHFDLALAYLQEGLEQSFRIGAKEWESDSYKYLAELYRLQGDFETALNYYLKHIALKEKIFSRDIADKIAQMQNKYSTNKIEKEAEIYRSIFEHTSVGFYRITPEGSVLMANNALTGMLGYSTSEELLHFNLHDWRKDTAHPILSFFNNITKQDVIPGLESVWLSRDGTPVCARESCKAIRDESGNVIYFEGTVEDITDLKMAEEKLKKSEEKYRNLVENMDEGIAILDANENFAFVNQAAANVLGYEKDGLIGQNLVSMIDPDMMPKFKQETELWRSGASSRYEIRIIRKDGEKRDISLIATPSIDEDGTYSGACGIFQDITDQKMAETERKKLLHDIKERVKKIDCLYELTRLAESQGTEPEAIFLGLADMIPRAWHYPEHTRARIIFENREFDSTPFIETRWKLEAPILIDGVKKGNIQVFHTKEFPQSHEGTFSKEERHLINELADRIGIVIHRRQVLELLAAERQRMAYILEGTNVGTWEWNVQTGETVFNERWAEIIGYTLEELQPVSIDTWMKFCHPEDLESSNELLKRHFSGELNYYECEVRMQHEIGAWVWVLNRGKVISWTDDGKPLLMAGTHKEITARKLSESRVEHLATHDALTELPTMRLAMDRMSMALEMARRSGHIVGVLFIDLDDFKHVNDRYGHEAGDNLLRVIADRFLSSIRKIDTVARIGGDEFLIILSELNSQSDITQIVENIVKSTASPVPFEGGEMKTGASIGISIFPNNADNAETLIKLADASMYIVKNSGKNGYAFS